MYSAPTSAQTDMADELSASLSAAQVSTRGDGRGPVLLAHDTTPGYVDTTPFPSAPVVWTYTAIYIVNDARVGQHSKPASITVGGK